MVNERFDLIEERLGRLEAGQTRLEAGQAQLEAGQTRLEAGQTRLESTQEELGLHMRVLHEDLVDRIKALPTDAVTRADMKREFQEMRETIGRRLDPLEAAVRRLSGS